MKTIAFGVLIVLFLVTESVADIQLMKVPQSKGELNFLCLTTSNEQDGDVEFISRNLTVCKVWTKTGEATLRNISVGESHFCEGLLLNTSLKGMLSQYTIVQPTSNSEGNWTCELRINGTIFERSKTVQVKIGDPVAYVQLKKAKSKGDLVFLCLAMADQKGDVQFKLRDETVCNVRTHEGTRNDVQLGKSPVCEGLVNDKPNNRSLNIMLSRLRIVQPTSNSEGDWTCELHVNGTMIEKSKAVQVKNINKENGDPVADVQLKGEQSRGELVFLCLAMADQKGDVEFKLRNETVCIVGTPEGTRKSPVCEELINDTLNNGRLNIMLSRLRIVQPTSNSEGDWTCEIHINGTMIGKSKAVQVKNISKENGGNILDGHGGSANCTPSSVGLFFVGMAFVICFILFCILKRKNGLTVGKSTCLSKLLCLAVRNDERLNNGAGRQPRVRYVEGSNDGAGVNLNPEDAAEPDDE